MHTAQVLNHQLLSGQQDHWLAQGTPCDGTVQPSGRQAARKNQQGMNRQHREFPFLGPQDSPPPLSPPAQTPHLSLDIWLQKEDSAMLEDLTNNI